MKCDHCGKEFDSGNRKDGVPNGVSFVLKNGQKLTFCAECLIAKGNATKEEKKTMTVGVVER